MRYKSRALTVALIGLAAAATAQNVKDQLDLTAKAVETQRRVLVAGALPMTEAEEKAFWPAYDDYEHDRRAIEERSNRLVADFVTSGASLSDAQAKAMLAEALQLDEQRLKLRRSLVGRLEKAIPSRKVVRFLQIENKLDSVVRADISKQIPLAP